MNHETSRSFCPAYPQQKDCNNQAGTLKIAETSAERYNIETNPAT